MTGAASPVRVLICGRKGLSASAGMTYCKRAAGVVN